MIQMALVDSHTYLTFDDHRVTAIPSPHPSCQQLMVQLTHPVDQEDPHLDFTRGDCEH